MTPKHQTGILFISYVTDLNLLEYLFYNLKFTRFLEILSICQLHILLSRTAQISLELHFCVELHTKKALSVEGMETSFAAYFLAHSVHRLTTDN